VPGDLPPIRGFLTCTLIDWPGRVAAEVFLGGCNFRCPFCHAAHLVLNPSQLEEIAPESVLEHLRVQRGWIDGVVISGGEPTADERLPALIEALRAAGAAIKLDTNGSRPEVLRALIEGGMLAAVSMDLKAPLDERYHRAAGVEVDLHAVRDSIDLLTSSDLDVEFRTTVCPAFHTHEDVVAMARASAGAAKYCLQTFQPLNCIAPALLQVKPYSDAEMRALAEAAGEFVERSWVRGAG
jgi:pyruvate formate lyase activating enzyme